MVAWIALMMEGSVLGQALERSLDGLALSRQTLAARVAEIEAGNDLGRFDDLEAWRQAQSVARQQLVEMLGLPDLENRGPVVATQTGILENDSIVVEKLYLESSPGLYVTANLYRPKDLTGKAPAILYVCGHGQVKEQGISLGNKTYYQHHPAWFAEHGYVCLAIDTIQLGEIEGIHHGLYRYQRWDWPAKGYTPAGVETWNSLRAVDYLVSRDDVDAQRIGITGRSGGGAYSWYTAAIDPRISVVVPVAGITDLRDHVIGNCVSGHCDCMYFCNRYGWDFHLLASMVHPRALLIGNTDEDPIFPLAGVTRLRNQVRSVYRWDGLENLGVHWTKGGHDDTPELQFGCFVWFDRHLMGRRLEHFDPARPRFEKRDLRVFARLPQDERVTTVQDWFIDEPSWNVPRDLQEWEAKKQGIRSEVLATIRGRLPWSVPEPEDTTPLIPEKQWELRWKDALVRGALLPVHPASHVYVLEIIRDVAPEVAPIRVRLPDSRVWTQLSDATQRGALDQTSFVESMNDLQLEDLAAREVWIFPEGRGPWQLDDSDPAVLHVKRSYLLCGWSLEGRQIAGIQRAFQWIRTQYPKNVMALQGEPGNGELLLHATLVEPKNIASLTLPDLAPSYRNRFILMGALRRFDLPQVLATVADEIEVALSTDAKIDITPLQAIERLRGRSLLSRDKVTR